ncbi:hypothetical protein [Saccharothrix stipae]
MALPLQLEALAVQVRDNAEVIRFLARGWTSPRSDLSLADLIEATAAAADRLRELGGHAVRAAVTQPGTQHRTGPASE